MSATSLPITKFFAGRAPAASALRCIGCGRNALLLPMRDRLPIFCFVILFQTSFSALNTMLLPFLRSGVQCDVHRPDLGSKISTLTPPDTRAPAELPKKRTKRQQTGRALDAIPRSRADWTGSTMCDDKDTVLATSQRADGWCTSLRVLVHMASTPLLGALADRHGRVRIVVLSVGLVTACLLRRAASAAPRLGSPASSGGSAGFLVAPCTRE